MHIHRPTVEVQGHYLCNDNHSASILILGFHGYMGTAESFYPCIERLACAQDSCLCAVQALHAFYTKNHRDHRQIGASWMTSFDREYAIADNNAYIHRVAQDLTQRMTQPKIILCGFSQGASLVYRVASYLRNQGCDITALIVVGGDVPPELSTEEMQSLPPILLARGDSDNVYTQERCTADMQRLTDSGAKVTQINYAGAHQWNNDCVQVINDFVTGL